MNSRIPLLKILTSVSFLLVVVSNEKFSLFMGLGLMLGLLNTGVEGFFYCAISLAANLYLFVSGVSKFNSKKDNILSLLSIGFIYVPVCMAIESSFKYSNLWVYISFILFGFISLLTFTQILIKLIKKV